MDIKDKHHDDFRPRAEVIPSMTRRRVGHDYESRRMYLITMTVGSRSMTPEQIAETCDYYLQQARAGAVLVSPCISPGEKHIMRTAFEACFPLILLQENGFSDLAKPNGAKFEACAKGQLLIIAPWERHNYHTTISRAQCLALNDLSREICS